METEASCFLVGILHVTRFKLYKAIAIYLIRFMHTNLENFELGSFY